MTEFTRGQEVLWKTTDGEIIVTVSSVALAAGMALVVDESNRMFGVQLTNLRAIPKPKQQEDSMSVNATIETETPTGFVVRFQLEPGYDREAVKQLVEGVEKFTQYLAGRSWTAPETSTVVQTSVPSAAEIASGPMFCGYPCSPTFDDRGLPSWIIADGRQATRHEKQGDVWYSYRGDNETYIQVLRIPKGEKAPAVTGV